VDEVDLTIDQQKALALASARKRASEASSASAEPKKEAEPLPFGTESLYKMAHDPGQKAQVLAHEYGAENVKTDPQSGEMYAEKEGKKFEGGKQGFWGGVGSSLVAGAAPMAGQIAGEIGGAALGSTLGPAGSVAGFVGGGGAGTAAGETVNNLILKYAANAHSNSMARDAIEGGESGALWSAAGGAVFKGIPWAYNIARDAAFAKSATVSEAFSKFRDFSKQLDEMKKAGLSTPEAIIDKAKGFFGMTDEALAKTVGGIERAEQQGAKLYTNIGTVATQSPALVQLEALADKFGVSKVLESTRNYAEKVGTKVAAKVGEAVEVGKSAFGKPVDVEALGRSLKIGAQEKFERAMADLTKSQQVAEKGWEATKGTLENSVKAFESQRDKFITDRLTDLGKIQKDMLTIAGHIGESGDLEAQNLFGSLSKQVAKEISEVKGQIQKAHGAVLEAAYDSAGNTQRVVNPGLVDELRGIVKDALPSEQPTILEILGKVLPSNLRQAAAMSSEGGVSQATHAGIAIGPEFPLPKPPLTVTLREANTLKQALGTQMKGVFDKLSPDTTDRLNKMLYGSIKDFIHSQGEDVPEAWKTAAREIEKSNASYQRMMEETESKTISPFIAEAKSGIVTRDLDVAARDVFGGSHPRDVLETLFSKYAPEGRAKLVGADMFNIFRDAVDTTGFKGQGVPPVNPLKIAQSFAERLENGTLKYYGDPKLIDSIKEFVQVASSFGLAEGKSLPTALVPSRTMQETIEGLTRSMKALEEHIKADPKAVFESQFKELEKGLKGSRVTRLAWEHPADLEAAAKEMMSHPSYVKEIVEQYGADSPQVKMLVDTFNKKLLSSSIEGQKILELPRHLDEMNIHPEVARLLSKEGSVEMITQLGQDMRHALDRAGDTYTSLYAGSKVQHPGGLAEPLLKKIPGVGRAVKYLGRTFDRYVLSKVVGVAASAMEHPNMYKLLKDGANMAPEVRQSMMKEWLQDVVVDIPVAGIRAAKWLQETFPDQVMQAASGQKIKLPLAWELAKSVEKTARKASEIGYHEEPSTQRQKKVDYQTRSAVRKGYNPAADIAQSIGNTR